MLRLLLAIAFVPLLAACSAPKMTFQIQLRNMGAEPVCVGLTKQSPREMNLPAEEYWTSPEQILLNAPALADRHWGTLIPPGETTVIGPVTGSFPAGVQPTLRIYGGNPTVEELTTFRRSDRDRLDILLWPGPSSYTISSAGGKLTVKRAE